MVGMDAAELHQLGLGRPDSLGSRAWGIAAGLPHPYLRLLEQDR
jgi:hypothetical protein